MLQRLVLAAAAAAGVVSPLPHVVPPLWPAELAVPVELAAPPASGDERPPLEIDAASHARVAVRPPVRPPRALLAPRAHVRVAVDAAAPAGVTTLAVDEAPLAAAVAVAATRLVSSRLVAATLLAAVIPPVFVTLPVSATLLGGPARPVAAPLVAAAVVAPTRARGPASVQPTHSVWQETLADALTTRRPLWMPLRRPCASWRPRRLMMILGRQVLVVVAVAGMAEKQRLGAERRQWPQTMMTRRMLMVRAVVIAASVAVVDVFARPRPPAAPAVASMPPRAPLARRSGADDDEVAAVDMKEERKNTTHEHEEGQQKLVDKRLLCDDDDHDITTVNGLT